MLLLVSYYGFWFLCTVFRNLVLVVMSFPVAQRPYCSFVVKRACASLLVLLCMNALFCQCLFVNIVVT